jgi:hypothetical protein
VITYVRVDIRGISLDENFPFDNSADVMDKDDSVPPVPTREGVGDPGGGGKLASCTG